MITLVYGNIIDTKSELLINASNGKGWMGGILGRFILLKGVAESIHFADPSIEKLAKKQVYKSKVNCGNYFITTSGKLDFPKGILHAVTMEKPGQLSSLAIIEKCLKNILEYCNKNNINTVTIPLLGTGTGKVDTDEVLLLYEKLLYSSNTTFYIVHYKK